MDVYEVSGAPRSTPRQKIGKTLDFFLPVIMTGHTQYLFILFNTLVTFLSVGQSIHFRDMMNR